MGLTAMSTKELNLESWLAQLQAGSCVTHFESREIPPEILDIVLEAGCQTVLPWNLQPWQFVVVTSLAGRERLLRHCLEPGPAVTAPALLIALGDPRAWKRAPARLSEMVISSSLPPGSEADHLQRIRQQWGTGDTARLFAIAQTHAALQQIRLVAMAYDISSWWMGEFDAAAIARDFHIPETLLVVAVLGLGYCVRRAVLPRASLARAVFAEAYGLPWRRPTEEKGS